MDFVIAAVYDNYVNAHLAMGMLQSENINCWLKDENIGTVLTNAVGGIKLMVTKPQLERALKLLNNTAE